MRESPNDAGDGQKALVSAVGARMRPLDAGRRAEDYAARYVESLGWRILGRNVSNRYGEIDIVAIDDADELVLIEVRFRSIGMIQSPLDSVGPKKLRTLVRAGHALTEKMGWTGFWRIDLIGITDEKQRGEQKPKLEHIRDITAGLL